MWFNDLDIYVLDNDCYIGDTTDQDADVSAGDVNSWRYCNLKHIFFKNKTAGSNTRIIAVGTLMSPGQIREYLAGWE